jgi:hypothetical protein
MIKNIKPINKLSVENEAGELEVIEHGTILEVSLKNREVLIGELCWVDETAFFIKRGEREIETEIELKEVENIEVLKIRKS